MSTSEFDTQLKSAWGNSSTYCTAYTFFVQGFTAAWNISRNNALEEALYIVNENRINSNGATMTIDSLRALLK